MTEIGIGEVVDGSAAAFRKELAAAPAGPVTVRINSVGGIVDEALDMYRAIVDRGGVTAYVTGLAASAATIPLCGADKVRMADGAQLMVHSPGTSVDGNAEQLRRSADALDRTNAAILQLYAARTGRDEKELLPLVRDETYLSATEALSLGFVDEIVPMRSRDLAHINLAKLPKPPVEFVRAVAKAKENMAAQRQTNAKVDPQIIEVLGLESDAPLEKVLATIMAMMEAQKPAEPEPEAAAPEPPAEPEAMAEGDPEDPMMAAVQDMPPEQQAKVLAVHTRTEARIKALESEARNALVSKVPANLRTWAKGVPIDTLRDFVNALPAETPRAATPPSRATATQEADGPTEAELAVAKALGRPVDYVRRTPKTERAQ